jgi:amidophosphoribosyltransferase
VIVDDSIVRGTTSKQLVKLIREAEPKEVHFRVTCPPIRYPCYYGMDFPSSKELIANAFDGNAKEIGKFIGADSLAYLSIEKMLEAAPKEDGKHYCTACFSGNYPVQIDLESEKNANDT